MNHTFLDYEKELLEQYLNSTIFHPTNSLNNRARGFELAPGAKSRIELIVRPECNQSCEYCYIARYGKDLYPIKDRINREQILTNLDIFLDYIFHEKEVLIEQWELFAGDMFYDGLYFDILDIFLKYAKELFENYPKLVRTYEPTIITPCNFSFITNDEQVEKLHMYIEKFHEIGWDIGLSVSTDGKYATGTREKKELPEEYFDKIFNFVTKYPRMGFHPMISASNVDVAIENYDWWVQKYEQYYNSDEQYNFITPVFLEVRNDEWTRSSLEKYKKLLSHVIDHRLALCNNNIDEFASHLFGGELSKLRKPPSDLIDLGLYKGRHFNDEGISCSIQSMLHITLNNFSIVPCHRLTYKQFKAGNFKVENGKITGIEAHNPSVLLEIQSMSALVQPKCSSCSLAPICVKGCYGAQYEASGELFLPALTVCDLFRTKYYFLIKTYEDMGVFKSAIEQGLLSKEVQDFIKNILEEMNEKRLEKKKRGECCQ